MFRKKSKVIIGTILEGIKGLNYSDDDVIELKDYKMMQPKIKGKQNDIKVKEEIESNKENKEQKEEVLLCQVGNHKNLNAHLTNELEKKLELLKIEQDKGRIYGYGKAISTLKALPFKVTSVNDIKNVAGLGKKMERLIGEILTTGKLHQVQQQMVRK